MNIDHTYISRAGAITALCESCSLKLSNLCRGYPTDNCRTTRTIAEGVATEKVTPDIKIRLTLGRLRMNYNATTQEARTAYLTALMDVERELFEASQEIADRRNIVINENPVCVGGGGGTGGTSYGKNVVYYYPYGDPGEAGR